MILQLTLFAYVGLSLGSITTLAVTITLIVHPQKLEKTNANNKFTHFVKISTFQVAAANEKYSRTFFLRIGILFEECSRRTGMT